MTDFLKNTYISILQKNNLWGKSEIEIDVEAEEMYESLKPSDIQSLEELRTFLKRRPATNLLVKSNSIISPVHLDENKELPIAELFIDNNNFVVYTTEGIFNCRKAKIDKISYYDVVSICEKSIHEFVSNRTKGSKFRDIELVTKTKGRLKILIEDGIPFAPTILFLTRISKNSKPLN